MFFFFCFGYLLSCLRQTDGERVEHEAACVKRHSSVREMATKKATTTQSQWTGWRAAEGEVG
jgi:hypothetical protein